MEGRVLAKRYGESYYQVLQAQNALVQGREDLEALAHILSQTTLEKVLANPNIGEEEKTKLLHGQFEGKLHPVTLRLLDLILHKRRAGYLSEIVDGIMDLMDDRAGIVDAVASTAFELPKPLVDKLHANLEKRTGKTVRLKVKVDPKLIGGITVRVGDAFLDGSYRSMLAAIAQKLKEARVA